VAGVERTATDSKRDAGPASQRHGALLAIQGRRRKVKGALAIHVQAHQEVALVSGTRYHFIPYYSALFQFILHKSAEHRML
jgi:hypothetical protein